ncbi:unnamed protein product, partial [Protopolystoma xenopodis]
MSLIGYSQKRPSPSPSKAVTKRQCRLPEVFTALLTDSPRKASALPSPLRVDAATDDDNDGNDDDDDNDDEDDMKSRSSSSNPARVDCRCSSRPDSTSGSVDGPHDLPSFSPL